MKQRTLLFIFLLLSTLTARAYDFVVDGIYYNFNSDGTSVSVTNGCTPSSVVGYSGVIEIPSIVTYEHKAYNVTGIGPSAFGTTKFAPLTLVIIPESVTTIGAYAFDYCSDLTSITIPKNVTTIGEYAFRGCKGSLTINCDYHPNNQEFNGSQFSEIRFDGNVKTIDNAFNGKDALNSVFIGNGVTSIGERAFQQCSHLTSVTIGNSVTSIGTSAFEGCSLTSVTIPNSAITIGEKAFYWCSSMTSVTIGNSVKTIEDFAFSYCSKLTDVYCYVKEVPSAGGYSFSYFPVSSATLHVPAESVSTYKATEPWSGFGNIVALEGSTVPGDVNGDGVVNGTDIQAIINLIVDGEYDEKADVNTDGIVNGTDIQEVINIIVEGE